MSAETQSLDALRARSVLGDLDVHFACVMARLAGERDARVSLAAALVSQRMQAGHVCLDLPRLCRGELTLETPDDTVALTWPPLDAWVSALRRSPLVGDEDALTPLYMDKDGRLYLRRSFEHERGLAHAIVARVRRPALKVADSVLRAGLDRLFGPTKSPAPTRPSRSQLELFEPPKSDEQESDLQRVAAAHAVERAFSVISGGPGTGKTATVAKILALLVEQAFAQQKRAPRVRLLAPTGKAAARLRESIKQAKAGLRCTPAVRDAIAEDASTIHRALGAIGRGGNRFRHNSDAPLVADVVVVDEASMVDLALMARLLDAVPDQARLILLGDKNQLASVEAGAVLGDICDAGLQTPRVEKLAASIVHLTHSYRYARDSGIRQLADAINEARPERVLEILHDPGLPDVSLIASAAGSPAPKALFTAAVLGFTPVFEAQGADEKLRALERFRVLCALRHGPRGQLAINGGIEAALRAAGRITTTSPRYSGCPIMVTQNDHEARLFNGDVGLLLQDSDEQERLRAFFPGTDGRLREIATARLPPYEGVYAMSVHKSQGSELDEVAVLLPSEPSPLLTRELLYTAVTRARKRVVLYASPEVIALAVSRSVERASGLRDALRRA